MLSLQFTPFPELTTDRLLLRKFSLADAPGVFQLRSNKETMKYINRPLTITMEEAEKWIQLLLDSLHANEGITWAITLKDQPENHIGNIGFWRIEKENYRAEIGYMLEPSLHGKGIMYEAMQEVLKYGFTVMHLHSVEAHLDPENIASAKLVEKAGFIKEGYFKENYFWNGRFSDTAIYSLLTPYLEAVVVENDS